MGALKPVNVFPIRVHWESALALVSLHLISLFAFNHWLFDWRSVALALFLTPALGITINLSFHRQLAHRSFRTPPWLEHSLVVLALCNLQDTPLTWVTNHRMHHKFSDGPEDPHSPKVSFGWSHWGWLFVVNHRSRPLDGFDVFSRDLLRDPFYRRLDRGSLREIVYFGHLLVIFLIGALWGGLDGGANEALRLGLSFALWGGIIRTVLVWHITWSVNSMTHCFGYRNYETGDDSRNNPLVAILSGGEGWHNNHHAHPACATNRIRWWEFDLVYGVIVVLERLGLATDVKREKA